MASTLVMVLFLLALTWDTLRQTRFGGLRVPSPTVINHKIGHRFDPEKGFFRPVIGQPQPLFGRFYRPEEAEALLIHGRLVIQSRNCMACHTFLGNGAYYAPDLTKA